MPKRSSGSNKVHETKANYRNEDTPNDSWENDVEQRKEWKYQKNLNVWMLKIKKSAVITIFFAVFLTKCFKILSRLICARRLHHVVTIGLRLPRSLIVEFEKLVILNYWLDIIKFFWSIIEIYYKTNHTSLFIICKNSLCAICNQS